MFGKGGFYRVKKGLRYDPTDPINKSQSRLGSPMSNSVLYNNAAPKLDLAQGHTSPLDTST